MSLHDLARLAFLAAPEGIVVATALILMALDLLWMRELDTRTRSIMGAMIGSVGCAAAAGWMLAAPAQANLFHGMWVVNPLTQLVKSLILGLTVFVLWLSAERNFTRHVSEYFALVLFSAAGMLLLASSEDTLMIFVSLELTSLPLYLLTAFKKDDVKSAEAALKYFLFGGMSAAFLLYGVSLLYGLSGSTSLSGIAAALGAKMRAGAGLDPLLILAIVLTAAGFGFKIAAVPFHLWAPDVYQGAPVCVSAFVASGSKLASFFVFAKVMMLGFAGAEGSGAWHDFASGWVPTLAVLAALSMVLGNLAAIAQTSVRRLLAYSAIAHTGYMLLGVMAHGWQSVASLVFYAATYGLTTIGAFGVAAVVEEGAGDDRLASFAGLSRRAPVASFCMMIFMLSLAGIPPLAGFFGKFYLFAAAVKTSASDLGLLWLVILAVGMSAVSLYYYLQVLKQIYVADPSPDIPEFRAPLLTNVTLGIIAVLVVILGCAPNLLVGVLEESLASIAK